MPVLTVINLKPAVAGSHKDKLWTHSQGKLNTEKHLISEAIWEWGVFNMNNNENSEGCIKMSSVRAAEISAESRSIFAHDPKGKVAEAYRELTKEVLKI